MSECDLGDGRDVVTGVLGHGDAAEQDGHDSREIEGFGESVGNVGEDEKKGELERRRLAEIHVFEELRELRMYLDLQ